MKALVFGGGGSKGSYEVGVCQALNKLGYTFDLVTGVVDVKLKMYKFDEIKMLN
ncbi:patatin-like phospholipase family protein, partial [Dubosiella newyorkensis]|uniref:patatin-like phospholipase family protein n=1 Tax=Dubosiella newyorkensis TaxID=1862672 RepID=UPI0026F3BC36